MKKLEGTKISCQSGNASTRGTITTKMGNGQATSSKKGK